MEARLKERLKPFMDHVKYDLEPMINQAISRTIEPSGQD